MKKILHIVGDSKFGGGSVIISQLATDQHFNGFNVSVLTTDQEFIDFLNARGINTFNLDCIWRSYNPFLDLFGVLKLTLFLKKHNFDLVHTHTTKAGFIGRISAFFAGVKSIVHTVHGFPFSELSSQQKISIFSYIEKILLKISTKVIFVSEYHKRWAYELGIATENCQKVVTIQNGVPNIPYQLYPNPKNKQRIIYVGRVVKEKGVFDLLHVFKKLYDSDDNFELVFIGDGPDLNQLKSTADGCTNIRFLGFVTDVSKFIYSDDIFVLPSYREGLSISAIEAQYFGLPSILSDVGGNIEISGNGEFSLIFRTGDLDSLSCAISDIINDTKKKSELSQRARLNYLSNFTSDKMLQSYMSLYQVLLYVK